MTGLIPSHLHIPFKYWRLFHSKKILSVLLTVTILLCASQIRAQGNRNNPARNRPRDRSTPQRQIPSTNGRPQSKVPTPSALPSQRLAAQGQVQKGTSQTSCKLQSSHVVGSTDIVEISVEGSGSVQNTGVLDVEEANIEMVAGFRYEERWTQYSTTPGATLQTVREYEQAGMKRKSGGTSVRPLLDASRKNITTQFDGKKLTLYSPAGPLKNDQYLLLSEMPGNSILLDYFLPNKTVKLGEEWRVPDTTLAAILGLDALQNNTVRCVLTAIIDDIAEVDIFLQGENDKDGNPLPSTIEGASAGASVSTDIQGKYQFDLKSKRITWLGLKIEENRSESLLGPGLNWSATIQIKIAPLDKPVHLTDTVTASLRAAPSPELMKLVYNASKGNWKFSHSREWQMVEDEEKTASLRMIANGEGVSLCNILSNGKIDRESMPSIDVFKDELKKGLEDRFGRFVDSAEYINEAQYLVYTVIIDGQYDEIPFRWIYHLLTDPEGNQTTLMFEISADKLDVPGATGEDIVQSFRMVVPTTDSTAFGIQATKKPATDHNNSEEPTTSEVETTETEKKN